MVYSLKPKKINKIKTATTQQPLNITAIHGLSSYLKRDNTVISIPLDEDDQFTSLGC
jgi:hypothetical protein